MSRWNKIIPEFQLGSGIPRLIHQVYVTESGASTLPPPLRKNVEYLKNGNPGWRHTLYDNSAVEQFILTVYGPSVWKAYEKINPEYGPARADLFRYLLVYKLGGVYLDIKSTFDRPLDQAIAGDEMFIISQWRNAAGEKHKNFGLYKELAHIAGGEFQQWHVIAASGHPFLRAAIIRVLDSIDKYKPWRAGVGKAGVVRTTGPIPYTLALERLNGPHTRIANESEIGLVFSIGDGYEHQTVFQKHYSMLESYIVKVPLWVRPLGWGFLRAKRLWQDLTSKCKR
jgi:inositol phosphorylceramide mannosyltransferase catalytic subunit